jgi:hypothetical protein
MVNPCEVGQLGSGGKIWMVFVVPVVADMYIVPVESLTLITWNFNF